MTASSFHSSSLRDFLQFTVYLSPILKMFPFFVYLLESVLMYEFLKHVSCYWRLSPSLYILYLSSVCPVWYFVSWDSHCWVLQFYFLFFISILILLLSSMFHLVTFFSKRCSSLNTLVVFVMSSLSWYHQWKASSLVYFYILKSPKMCFFLPLSIKYSLNIYWKAEVIDV